MTLAMFALAYLAVLRARLQVQSAQRAFAPPDANAAEVAKEGHISSRST